MGDGEATILFQCLPDLFAGAEKFLYRLVTRLDRKRFHPIVFFPGAGPVVRIFRAAGIETKVIAPTRNALSAELVDFLKFRKVRVAQSSQLYPMLAFAAKRAGIPHVWRPGGAMHLVYGRLERSHMQSYLSAIALLSTTAVFPSKYLREYYRRHAGIDGPVIYNGVDFAEMGTPVVTNSKPTRVGMVAHLVSQKRHIDFIRAAAVIARRHPEVTFPIYGAPHANVKSRRYAKKLRDVVHELQLDRRVVFRSLSGNVLSAIHELDIAVLPSLDEGASNAILEAMACAKPMIVSDSGSNPELVTKKTGIVVPAKSSRALATAISELLENKKKMTSMGREGLERAKKHFDIRITVEKFEKIYRRLAV